MTVLSQTLTAVRSSARRGLADALVGTVGWLRTAGVVGAGSRHARRFYEVGPGSAFAFPPGPSMGEQWIKVGSETLIGPNVVLSAGMWPTEPLVPPKGWTLRIGNRCNVGRGTQIISRMSIDIGDDVTIAPNVYITDHNHEYVVPDLAIAKQWLVEKPVEIGAGGWLGVGAVVVGAKIGEHVAVAAGSVVRGDIPSHCVVAGAPAKIVRRWDHDSATWDPPVGKGRGTEADGIPPGWYEIVRSGAEPNRPTPTQGDG